MATTEIVLKEKQVQQIKDICKQFNNESGELINVLHKTQSLFGYLPSEVQVVIAQELNMPLAKVFGVVTFYSYFTMTPRGEHPIDVCMGTACYVRGAEKVLEEFKRQLKIEIGETTPDGKFSINSLRCVGACGLAPVVIVGDKTYGAVTSTDVKNILKEYESK
jgi:NADP-reducing hydrogenase subunit HndA